MLNDFDPAYVKVGIGSYGGLYIRNDCNKSNIKIGNYCSIASGVRFLANCDHPTNQVSTFPFADLILHLGGETVTKGDIIIDDDVWIGMNTIILSGVHIGQGAVIGAGSVVSQDVPPYSVVVGNPGKVIKKRFENDIIDKLLQVDYSKMDKSFIEKNKQRLYTPVKELDNLEWLPQKNNNNSKTG